MDALRILLEYFLTVALIVLGCFGAAGLLSLLSPRKRKPEDDKWTRYDGV